MYISRIFVFATSIMEKVYRRIRIILYAHDVL